MPRTLIYTVIPRRFSEAELEMLIADDLCSLTCVKWLRTKNKTFYCLSCASIMESLTDGKLSVMISNVTDEC